MKYNNRAVHRDFAYFFVGLIIAFSLSGIFLNHRGSWNPRNYTYQTEPVEIKLPETEKEITKEYLLEQSKQWNLEKKFRGFRIREDKLQIDFENNRFLVDAKTGKGEREYYIQTPILGQTMQLHVDTSVAWIWYSDIFGIAMLLIACTGMFIQKGDRSFWKRGWKLASAGILFPLIFLFLLS
ncbi:MAG: PepSY-associated TM helix domain-containing protein [Acidobacteria bacterium]|nr:PepSY-associated TM helix domain-containing protein [Acidobacteriota bacterium]